MRELTQTTTGEWGNCWQTCVACLLDIDPETMPSQADLCQKRGTDGYYSGPGYWNPLQAFLRDHHALTYFEVQALAMAGLVVKEPGLHMTAGPTVRTPSTGLQHVVVARHGEMIWDPHPSRAGLTKVERVGLLLPWPEAWDLNDSRALNACVCQACSPKESC